MAGGGGGGGGLKLSPSAVSVCACAAFEASTRKFRGYTAGISFATSGGRARLIQ